MRLYNHTKENPFQGECNCTRKNPFQRCYAIALERTPSKESVYLHQEKLLPRRVCKSSEASIEDL